MSLNMLVNTGVYGSETDHLFFFFLAMIMSIELITANARKQRNLLVVTIIFAACLLAYNALIEQRTIFFVYTARKIYYTIKIYTSLYFLPATQLLSISKC
jgi:hypothetical protein